MSKRLQVLMPDRDMAAIQRYANRDGVPVGEWVRRTLRDARHRQPVNDPDRKLRAIREAAEYSFPTADIKVMLSEIESDFDRWPGLKRIY